MVCPPNMRRTLLLGSFAVLLTALCVLWHYRFQRSTGLPVWHLADLRESSPSVPGVVWSGSSLNPALELHAESGGPQVAARLLIPAATAVSGLRLRFRLSAHGLVGGAEPWQDGRFFIEWHDPDDPGKRENDPVGSTRDDIDGGLENFIIQPLHRPAIPALRLEHMGRAGGFVLSDLEITAVEERPVWKVGSWLLAAGWIAWAATCVRSWPGIKWWRACCSAVVWFFVVSQCVVPGPWKIQRDLFSQFQIGGHARQDEVSATARSSEAGERPAIEAGPLAPIGKPPENANLMLRVKYRIVQARPLLHMLMLLGPTLVIACFVRGQPAAFLCAVLAIGTEAAETAFGYGFDWLDVGDLASDAAGIIIAVWIHKKLLEMTLTVKLPRYISVFLHFPSLPRQPS